MSGNRFVAQKLRDNVSCDVEHFHGGENRWAKVQAFFLYAQLHVTTSLSPHNRLVSLFDLVE
jgi:hypothetical protein